MAWGYRMVKENEEMITRFGTIDERDDQQTARHCSRKLMQQSKNVKSHVFFGF